MDDISTVDGFVEITECMAEMVKYLANEPSVGLFYVQQHTQNTVPNLITLRNNVEGKSREMTLHTEDAEDSISILRSMKECGCPIADEMIRDINNSLAVMSTKQPKRGLINSPSSFFQMGRNSSWGPATWGRNEVSSEQEVGSTSNYFTTVFKSAKDRASSLKWSQFDSDESIQAKGENLPSFLDPTLQTAVSRTSSSMPSTTIEESTLSSKICNGLQEESQIDESLLTNQLTLSGSFDEFKAEREAKLQKWLEETTDQDDQSREPNVEKV